jgi:hypothetical protein
MRGGRGGEEKEIVRTGEIGSHSVQLVRALAGDRADRYIPEFLLHPLERVFQTDNLTLRDLRDAFSDPYLCLRALLGHYAFCRRGKDRAELSSLAIEALERTCDEDEFESFLEEPDAGRLWEGFLKACEESRRKPLEQLNRGVIAGLGELAQEVYRLDNVGSVAGWVLKGVLQTDRVEPQFLRIVDIRGVGPKISSLFLRDVAHVFGLEAQIDRADRLYVQPIDKWLRLLAPYVIDEPDVEVPADWVLAGKLAKYSRLAGVSGIRFNMGATYFGMREVKVPEMLDQVVEALLSPKD